MNRPTRKSNPSKTGNAARRQGARAAGEARSSRPTSRNAAALQVDGARLPVALMSHTAMVLGEVLTFAYPADAVLSRYFRENRALGHADRGFIAETVFLVLRRLRSLQAACLADGGGATPRRLILAALLRYRGMSTRELAEALGNGLSKSEAEWLPTLKASRDADLPAAVRREWPDWLDARLDAQFGPAEADALATALHRAAPLDLRVNTLKAERDAVLERLRADGIAAEPTPYSPLGIRLADKPALQRHPLFLDGSIEVQDEGSQLLGFLVAPKRGEMVMDLCAGAGGKTLMLGAQMKSLGRLYACDVSEKRLANLKPRLARSGLSNVHPIRIDNERDVKLSRLAGKLDRVLVDAPCSGLGTLRRNPDLKWRQQEGDVAELAAKQGAILAAAAKLVKPGGRLVYATCSLLDAENGAVADAFLAAHPDFAPVSAAEVLARQGIAVPEAGERLALLPQRHGSDGFFAAVFARAEAVKAEAAPAVAADTATETPE